MKNTSLLRNCDVAIANVDAISSSPTAPLIKPYASCDYYFTYITTAVTTLFV